jgi:MFS family permease
MGQGLFMSALGPPAQLLITDYFPPEKRTRANSIYLLAPYIGSAIVSLTILLIEAIGWRQTFFLAGSIGVVFAILCAAIVKEPPRGVFEAFKAEPEPSTETSRDGDAVDHLLATDSQITQPKPARKKMTVKQLCQQYAKGFKIMFQDRCCMWLLVGSSCRFWQRYVLQMFSLSYFNIYDKEAMFSIVNAFVVIVGGLCSNMLSGYICDRFEADNLRTKAYVSSAMSAVATVLFVIIFIMPVNFWLSMVLLFLEYLFAEGWQPPVVTMIQ